MNLVDGLAVFAGKLVGSASRRLKLGAGATWPGELALNFRPAIAKVLASQLQAGVILIAGTNGKTTTALMIKKILEQSGQTVVHNQSGANLLNGVVSAFINQVDWSGRVKADWGVFEVDENSLPAVISNVSREAGYSSQMSNRKQKLIVVLLNLFRDQLDRYGEVDVIVEKWERALGAQGQKDVKIIANADDPGIAYLGRKAKGKVVYFGLNDQKHFLKGTEHATDSSFCLNCGGRLTYEGIYYSHLGLWSCDRCGWSRPKPSVSSFRPALPGLYNYYNTLAAVSVARTLGIGESTITKSLTSFSPAFGRQEEFVVRGRKIKLFLSKNPAGFNASLRTVLEQGAKYLLMVLNDRIPDGRDVSWIWDVDFEMLSADKCQVFVSGDRVYDLALRLKYAETKPKLVVEPELLRAVHAAVEATPKGKTLFVLPTYSAMLEIRKILIGRKIL